LAAAEHRDEDTWECILDASQQGLSPDYTIADAAKGLRAKQQLAKTPCHGDIFHIQHQGKELVSFPPDERLQLILAKARAGDAQS